MRHDAGLHFADLITLLNLSAGLLAINASLRGDRVTAVALVFAGMLFDFLDGRVARLLRQEHLLGQELDSLADLTSFGVAVVVIALTRSASLFLLAATLLYLCAMADRLARFATRHSARAQGFLGLPSPAAALLPLAALLQPALLTASFLVAAVLMVAPIKVKKL